MRITAAQASALGRKQDQPTRGPGEVLAIFVSGRLINALNDHGWIWQKRTRYARQWKERVALAIFEHYSLARPESVHIHRYTPMLDMQALGPKHVTFLASTHNTMDSDGLQAALKPIRDALTECGVITGDAPKDGNVFWYQQKIDRKHRGVEIRVKPIADPPPAIKAALSMKSPHSHGTDLLA